MSDGLCGHNATLQKNTASFRVQELCEERVVVQCWEECWRAFVRSLDSFGGASGDRDPGRLWCGVCWGGGGGIPNTMTAVIPPE